MREACFFFHHFVRLSLSVLSFVYFNTPTPFGGALAVSWVFGMVFSLSGLTHSQASSPSKLVECVFVVFIARDVVAASVIGANCSPSL